MRTAQTMTEVGKRVKKVLKHLTYKPNWNLILDPRTDTVYIETKVPDASKRWDRDNVYVRSAVPFTPELAADDAMILARLKHGIRRMEQHEIEEWLRFDDVPLNDPHPEISKPTIMLCTCEPRWSELPSYCDLHGHGSVYADPPK
jgi:hypothetical protein